ncbi:hypothetical protein OCU04_003878 [Sclerotinia nivalis]|uniref:Uncharacterized protein n=1 Tax=Sclerotinia nivalis TaxID=352851 RepID=A0A9X0AST8_9HELO|nr:hypothetical protein OCU04_003878 [Sclerotinia nivalis]
MTADASAHSNLVTLHTHFHSLLLKLSLTLHLSSPCPHSSNQQQPTQHPPTTHANRLSQHLSSLSPTYKPPPNPHDPLEVLYTLSPPAFHYLPRSTLLPPQIVRQGFMETPENSPPLLEGRRMQIMVIPRGVREVVIHFLVYDPVRKEKREKSTAKENRKISPLSSTSGSSSRDSSSNSKTANPQTQIQKQTSRNKLRKKISTNLHPTSKPRDQITNQRSTSRLSNTSAEPNARLSMNQNHNRDRDRDSNLNLNLDGMEIEVLRKEAMSVMDSEQREEDEQGEYVVMKRVVRLPRRVWCGRNINSNNFLSGELDAMHVMDRYEDAGEEANGEDVSVSQASFCCGYFHVVIDTGFSLLAFRYRRPV